MADARDSDSPYGLHDFLSWNHPWNRHHYDDAKRSAALDLMKDSGAAWLRLDFIRADIEPELGTYNFEKYDRLVDEVLSRGLKILALLAYGPGGGRPWPEVTDPQRYADFATAVVRRYKDRIRHWEVWNEPDHALFWQPQDGLKGYSSLLKAAYPAIKREDPTSIVHAAGLSQGLPRSLKNLYAESGRNHFDVVNIHPFVNPLTPDAMGTLSYLVEAVLQTMRQNGDTDKDLWITQIGCPGLLDPHQAPPWWLGKNPTETHQAGWVRVLYAELLKMPGVKKVFWSFFRDTQDFFGSGADRFGLVRNDLSRKPAFEAYQRVALATSSSK